MYECCKCSAAEQSLKLHIKLTIALMWKVSACLPYDLSKESCMRKRGLNDSAFPISYHELFYSADWDH